MANMDSPSLRNATGAARTTGTMAAYQLGRALAFVLYFDPDDSQAERECRRVQMTLDLIERSGGWTVDAWRGYRDEQVTIAEGMR